MKYSQFATIILLLLIACAPTPAPAPQAAGVTGVVTATPQVVIVTPTPEPIHTPTVTQTSTIEPTSTPTRTPSLTRTPLPPVAVSFYRLRIDYSTTSDWAILELKNLDRILTTRLMGVSGRATLATASAERLHLQQPLEAARAGQRVGVVMDYAIAADALNQPLAFLLKRGGLNETNMRVFNVVGSEIQPVQEIRHQGVVQSDPNLNPLEFSLDLNLLKNTPPRQAQIQRVPKMLWAFYYVWYSYADWSKPLLKDHPTTLYSSDEPSTVARHIEQAQRAGIDGFIVSWFGSGYTDRNLKLLLDLAEDRNFYVAIYLETLKDDGSPRDVDTLYRWLAYAISTYRDHPAFMKVNGKPVIAIWSSESVPLTDWKNIFAKLRQQGLDATYLAKQYNTTNLQVFDGLHEYGVVEIPNLAQTAAAVGRDTRYYPLLADSAASKIWAATIQPGYDERLIPGRRGVFKERDNGAFYRSTFEAALNSNPDWVFITSWNEWWENTHIEPSQLYGNQYLQVTREFADKWKGK